MARIRSIKPEVLLDEELWDLEVDTGLPVYRAFTGLWCHSDREGRFEWRPRRLKTGILPYWDGDFSRVLDALATRGFVVRYTSGGREFGVVRTFKEHQAINGKEAASVLPAPPESAFTFKGVTREPRVDDASATCPGKAPGEGKGKEGKGGERASGTRGDAGASEPTIPGARFAIAFTAASGGRWMGSYSNDPERFDRFAQLCDQAAAEYAAVCERYWLVTTSKVPGPRGMDGLIANLIPEVLDPDKRPENRTAPQPPDEWAGAIVRGGAT